jgi:hypothetical protein
MLTYNYYYYTPHEHSSGRIGFVCVCVYSDEFFILAGDICDELSKTNAPFSAPTLIGSDDMTAPSFANQIHMTTGEDRRRSTHTRTNIIIWQSPCEPRLTSQLKSPNRSAVSSVFISRGCCHSRRESSSRVLTSETSDRRPYLLDDNDTHQVFAELMHRQYLFSHRHTS